MSLKARILDDMKAAMKAKDQLKLRVVRSLKTDIQKKEIEQRKGDDVQLSDAEVVAVLQKAAKQRKDSISQFEDANRNDLAENEKAELAIIETYLPKMMDEAEIKAIAEEVIQQTGASAPSDMGKVMGAMMPKVKGKADGGIVNKVVKELLTQ